MPFFKERKSKEPVDRRLLCLKMFFSLLTLAVAGKLFVLQVLDHDAYAKAAEMRHGLYKDLLPTRGNIYLTDLKQAGEKYPLAINRFVFIISADPKKIKDAGHAAQVLAKKLELNEQDVLAKLKQTNSRYEILKKRVNSDVVEQLRLENLYGIGYEKERYRFYPEKELAGQVSGYYGLDTEKGYHGYYGVEGYFEDLLAGRMGYISGERDARGGWLPLAERVLKPAVDGADIVLTIDRTIEAFACQKLKAGRELYGAKSGTLVIMDPQTGAILAMCNEPSFDPNNYQLTKDIRVFNNAAIFTPYEPGSVFKAITMAAGLDSGKITPETTFVDTGSVVFGKDTIRNAGNKIYGAQNMVGVLKESINTGVVFVSQRLGRETFKKYVNDFGFGSLTGIELDSETTGNLAALDKKAEIYLAAASFGQGISVTPMQLASAYSTIANQGRFYKPYIVSEVDYPDGFIDKHASQLIRQVISERSAKLLSAMLTVVVSEGHGKAAGVPGYYIAGKTGTAEISAPGGGYLANATNHTFVGFGPVDNPRFVIVVKYEEPQRVYAESTAVPVAGEIAKFLLQYLEVPPAKGG